jgi:hypothetical protein
MINLINGDKPISPATERSGESHKSAKPEQANLPSGTTEAQPDKPVGSNVEIDQARQLYNLETQANRPPASAVETPAAARSLLNTIMEQFRSTPEQAFKSQATQVSTPLAKLLEQAPA